MKYEEIKTLIEKYGEDYLGQNAISQILNITKDSPSMQAQLEKGITEEWLNALKERGAVYVYTDPRRPNLNEVNKTYPCMEVTFQDEKNILDPNGKTTRTPVIRYAYQIQKLMAMPSPLGIEANHQREIEMLTKKIEYDENIK